MPSCFRLLALGAGASFCFSLALHAASFSAWSLEKLGTPAAAPCADEDGDGVATLWEYYAARDPRVADGPLPGGPGIDQSVGTAVLTATLPAPQADTDATVEWQVSSDLVTWTTVATSVNGAPFSGAGSQGVAGGFAKFRDPSPTAAPQRFGRWKISATSAGPGALGAAPVVNLLRDDHVATLEMDYRAEHAWGQWWVVGEDGRSDAGFRVTWWPDGASPTAMKSMGGCGGCNGACGKSTSGTAVAKTLVTPHRRVQIQPLENDAVYHVRVERLNALGEITSTPTEMTFNGGDGTRVAALRSSLTYFDDFNLPEGPADPFLWNNAHTTSTDARYNLFFVNAQLHAHTLNGTQTRGPHEGDKSQVAQRFRKPIAIESGVRRRIVFDMDSPMSPRSVWYLDLNPVPTDLTGHADFFDMDGTTGLPAGVLRLRSQFQQFSVHRIGPDGASYKIADVDMEDAGVQAVPNVRRAFDVRVGTDGIQVFIDGKSVIDASFGATPLAAGTYELLWSTIGYNTSKDNNPYFLVHWDNFGFDGPIVEPRTVHNYVTQLAGDDFQKSERGSGTYPTFTVQIPDDLRPTVAGATGEAWLVWTYQMGDYSLFYQLPGDYLRMNNAVNFPLPARGNNSTPVNADLLTWDKPFTVRVKLGDLTAASSPLTLGANTFRFFADNTGIENVHVEAFYPPGSAPAYTPPAAIHPFPMHADLPKLGPPARLQKIGDTEVDLYNDGIDDPTKYLIDVSGRTRVAVLAGNECYAGWAPDLMVFPAASAEIWSSGGTAGIRSVEMFLRPHGAPASTAQRVAVLSTSRDAPAPQVRHVFEIDTTAFPNGTYDLFVLATDSNGVKSHPTYAHSAFRWDSSEWSGAYYPVCVRITN